MLRLDDARLERQKFKEIAQEQTVRIELPKLCQLRAHQALTVVEGLVKQRELAERQGVLRCLPDHPRERNARDYEADHAGSCFSHALSRHQIDPLVPKPLTQALVGRLEVITQIEDTQLRSRFSRGQQPIEVPRATLIPRAISAPLMFAQGRSQDDGESGHRAEEERNWKP